MTHTPQELLLSSSASQCGKLLPPALPRTAPLRAGRLRNLSGPREHTRSLSPLSLQFGSLTFPNPAFCPSRLAGGISIFPNFAGCMAGISSRPELFPAPQRDAIQAKPGTGWQLPDPAPATEGQLQVQERPGKTAPASGSHWGKHSSGLSPQLWRLQFLI